MKWVDIAHSKCAARLGVWVRVPRLVLGEAKRFNTSARVRVLWPTLGRVALRLVPPVGRWCPTFGGWCAGFVARCACSMAVLFPSFWTVIQHGCWVRLLIGSLTLCGWGSIPLLSARVLHGCVGGVFTSFGASKRRLRDSYLFLVSATSGRLSASSGWAHSLVGVCSGGSLSPVAGP